MSLLGWFRRQWCGTTRGLPPLETDPDRGGRETPIMVSGAWRCFLGKKYVDDLSHYLQDSQWPRTEWGAGAHAGRTPAAGEPGENPGS
jgi:hypothetical protein